MKFKPAGCVTKIVVLVLMIYMATSLLNLLGQLKTVQAQRDTLEQQVISQQLDNQRLSDAIENSDDPDMLERVARAKGFVRQGEELYIDVAS